MSKRLVLVFCALFVLASAVPAFAAVQNIKVSGDILAREVMRNNFDLVKGDGVAGEDEMQLTNSVVRIRVDADLTDNVQTTLRLINERNWGVHTAEASDSDIDLDLAYVTLKEFFCSPLSLAIGRQELHFGNDMIMGDGVGDQTSGLLSGLMGTNQTTSYGEATGLQSRNGDLAYRKAFDAVRATLNYDPLVIDVVAAKIDEDTIIGGDSTDDVTLFGMNAGYKFSDDWRFIGGDLSRSFSVTRCSCVPLCNPSRVRLKLAHQFPRRNPVTLRHELPPTKLPNDQDKAAGTGRRHHWQPDLTPARLHPLVLCVSPSAS